MYVLQHLADSQSGIVLPAPEITEQHVLRKCRYDLTTFSLRLNEMTPGLEGRLPPTDARRRWDLKALEEGNYNEVSA